MTQPYDERRGGLIDHGWGFFVFVLTFCVCIFGPFTILFTFSVAIPFRYWFERGW
jgi:hypothetical protein